MPDDLSFFPSKALKCWWRVPASSRSGVLQTLLAGEGCVCAGGLLRVRLWELEVPGSLSSLSLTCVAVPTRLERFRIVLTGADGRGGCGQSRTRSH